VKSWDDLLAVVNLKFEKPEEVSADVSPDQILVKLLAPWLFVS